VGERADEPPPKPVSPAPKDEEIERLRREVEWLRRENERLKRELDLARRAAKRQAAPFSKGAPTPTPRPSGRHAGRQHGRHGHREPPGHIDETIDVPLPSDCPTCGGPLDETRVAEQIQEELPVVRPHVRRFQVHIGRCCACGRRVQGRHPLQTSDALGAARSHLGPQAVALIVLLNKYLGLSHGKIATLLREWFDLGLRPSAVTLALHRAARQAAPTYDALRAAIRASPVVSPDETSWKVAGHLQWLWAFATPSVILYAIQAGRGFPQAAAILGADYDGVLVRDGWAPYRQFEDAAHQTCLAHLLRRSRELASDHPRAQWPARITDVLQRALAVRDRRNAGDITAHGAAIARGRLFNQLADLVNDPVRTPAFQRFAAHRPSNCRRSSAFFSIRASMRPTGARSKRCGPPSSIAKCPAAIARRAALRPSRFSPASSTPRVCVTWTRATCSSTCCARVNQSSLRHSRCRG
jgi:transposase